MLDGINLREVATDALRYWEPRRIVYNVLLAGIVLYYLWLGQVNVLASFDLNAVLELFILAVLANVAYCAAYLVDLFIQLSYFREQRGRWRLVIMGVGFAFAAALTRFFALGLAHPAAG